jgi:SAM-dependent methyltransferase
MPNASPDPVRRMYEALPYPERDPSEEKSRLLRTWLDDLPMINHYGFGGRRDFRRGFRVLVAGGGTGDATVFLAEQLRRTDAEIVHLDFSRMSLAIARRRAEARGLANIRWVEASLLDLPSLPLGPFDYVNCVGVLHHLPDPDEGLRALLGCLAPDGVLGLMLYGRIGRTGVYQMQELLRLALGDEPEMRKRLERARELLAVTPRTNWFARAQDLYSDHRRGDAGLADLLLHPQDRAYTVEEVFAWLADGHGLHLEFTDVQRGKSAYLPHLRMGPKPPRWIERIRAAPLRRQHAIAELLLGDVQTHSLFATRRPAVATYGDPDMIPFFFHEPLTGPEVARFLATGKGQPVVLAHVHTGLEITVAPGRHGPAILERIDGRASFGRIFEAVRALGGHIGTPPTDAQLFEDFRAVFETFSAIDRLLLRHPEAGELLTA